MINAKFISMLEKVQIKDSYADLKEKTDFTVLQGERLSFQVAFEYVHSSGYFEIPSLSVTTTVKTDLPFKFYEAELAPLRTPVDIGRSDDDYITKAPTLLPDELVELKNGTGFVYTHGGPNAIIFTVEIPKDIPAGKYPFEINLFHRCFDVDETNTVLKAEIEVKPAQIIDHEMIYTNWFHCDCLATYYDVKPLSERHWEIIENFVKAAVRTGMNMIYTPIFTPALDTNPGSERPTVQLVKIEKKGDKYTFDFTLFERWVKMCKNAGIKYFEIAHLCTQWGARFCPKVVVKENGRNKKMFGWHTYSNSKKYVEMLRQLFPQLVSQIKRLGIADNTYFHISDEPNSDEVIMKREGRDDFKYYSEMQSLIRPMVPGFKFMDACSHVDFFDNGLIEIPVCASDAIEPFMQRDIKERWCYNCCIQGDQTPNRFIAMPSWRNRAQGVTMYMMGMMGFLHWGFNFYYSGRSVFPIDPRNTTDAWKSFPSGDPFIVYPAKDGTANPSLRSIVLYEAFQDVAMLQMLEKKIGKEATRKFVLDLAGLDEITFKVYPKNAEFYEKLHTELVKKLG